MTSSTVEQRFGRFVTALAALLLADALLLAPLFWVALRAPRFLWPSLGLYLAASLAMGAAR